MITPHDFVYDVDDEYSYLSIPLSVEYRNYLLIILSIHDYQHTANNASFVQ
jgi:hypothetical protein